MFPWTAALGHFLDDAFEGADTHSALAVTGEGIMARKGVSAETGVGFYSRVDFGVAFEVVLADEAFPTDFAAVLAVAEMCLDVRFDVRRRCGSKVDRYLF